MYKTNNLPSILTPIFLFNDECIRFLIFGILKLTIYEEYIFSNTPFNECPVPIQTNVFSK